MRPRERVRLGDLLLQDERITESQLEEAIADQARNGRKLGATLISMGYLSESELAESLARQLGLEKIQLDRFELDPELVTRVPEIQARRFRAIVLREYDDEYLVGTSDPTDIFAQDELARILQRPVRFAVVTESSLVAAIDRTYRRTEEISSLAEELGAELEASDFDVEALTEDVDQADIPVVRLLRTLFEDAVQVGATDIHIEPDEQVLRIRQRVDGALQEQVMRERRIAPAVALRLKLMAGLDISEKRLPQDGRFNLRVRERSVDVRLSTMPVRYGESVVMRLLDQSAVELVLDQLGMQEAMAARLRRQVRQPNGMILVTGPTGSGKTTTLYAALRELNQADRKIITAEDPIEYRLPRINQVQVQNRIGLTFANILRSALRQDPDIILVGEMRDEETVDIGLRAAMTGHLVLSTLHTNDAVATVDRLLDMGAPGYLLAATLRAVIGQRLLRRVCEQCSQPEPMDDGQAAWVAGLFGEEAADRLSFRRGRGCNFCGYTGYSGRTAVFEFLELDADMRSALRGGDSERFHAAAYKAEFYKPLVLAAFELAVRGVTTLAEAERVAGEMEQAFERGHLSLDDLALPAQEA